MVATIQSTIIDTTSDPSFRQVTAATAQLWDRIRTLDQESDKGSQNGTLCSFFADAARYLCGDDDFLVGVCSRYSNELDLS